MKILKTICVFVSFLFLCFGNVFAAEYASFESFYSAGGLGFWGWTLIITGTIAIGVAAFFTFGGTAAAAPAWMAAVGSWIGSTAGLSGIAASNFGLALLGGGAVAAGGLGVAGGVAVLSMALSFGVDMAFYGTDIALEKWDQAKFIEANKEMGTLPIPRNEKGGKGYKSTMKYLKDNYNSEKPISDPANQTVLNSAISILATNGSAETDNDYILRDKTLLALLYMQTNDFENATRLAGEAVGIAGRIKRMGTLPSFIYALSELASPNKTCSYYVMDALRVAYHEEPANKLLPILTAACMDRMMYKYHYGEFHADYLSQFCRIITDERVDKNLAAASLEIFIMRGLIELKRTKQDIYVVTNDRSMMAESAVIEELRKRFDRHRDLISVLRTEALPQISRLSPSLPKESKLNAYELAGLLEKYSDDLLSLDRQIRNTPAETGISQTQQSMSVVSVSKNNGVERLHDVNIYFRAAEQGNAGAQDALASCYFLGYGVEHSYSEAAKWFRKAAEQGYASAQNSLGNCYAFGWGVKQDYAEAAKWYRKAAEQGNVYAQKALGNCYAFGWGVAKNNSEAEKWYRKAQE